MPRTFMHVIAEDKDRPSSVLLSTVSYDDIDPMKGLVVEHDTGTGWTSRPISLQSMLKADDWRPPRRTEVIADIKPEVIAALERAASA